MGIEYSPRELKLGVYVGVAFLVAAVSFWIAGGMPAPGMTGLWLTLLIALLSGVSFHVEKGYCSPLMLAFAPMLLLVPGPVVPLLVAAGQLAQRLPWLLRGRRDLWLLLPLGDSVFSLAPALLMTLVPLPASTAGQAALLACAYVLWVANDLSYWPMMLWFGRGVNPRTEMRSAAWIYAFDGLLVPLGFAIALATREVPAAPIAILPLAALLAFFARERRNRTAQAATLQTILQHASDLILIVERDGRLRRVLGASQSLLGDALVKGTLLDRVHPDDVATVTRFLAAAPGEAEWRLRHDDGSYRHVHGVAADLTADPHVSALVVTVRDDEVRRALRHRASHDPLTGLANRALFDERLHAALAAGEAAVLIADLNDFKPINDRLGHAAGDEVLRLVARRLEGCVRMGDTVARLGGDEFAFVLGDPEGVDAVAARVHAALATPLTIGAEALTVSASVGVAVGAEDAEALLEIADRAMYEAKRTQAA